MKVYLSPRAAGILELCDRGTRLGSPRKRRQYRPYGFVSDPGSRLRFAETRSRFLAPSRGSDADRPPGLGPSPPRPGALCQHEL